ncbi:hypothetical protein LIER_32181 [Lithospermum erythrorhizon]|uniref:Uncharacterized protein n=1 Tax=Lithospermum erythrorhizon TaxID=34254 RepID=A0AAV3RT64_LITER
MPKCDGGLGFKDLECMILALLARQGWHILTSQPSHLYKILKGRYFRNSSFLNPNMSSNPTFGWRSLIEGKKVLSRGVRWRVGDGKGIDIWKDPWIPRRTNFKMRRARGDEPRWVSQLMLGNECDTHAVRRGFWKRRTRKECWLSP